MIPPLDSALVREMVQRALAEDLGAAGDLTSSALIPASSQATGVIEARQAGAVSGMGLAEEAFRQVDSAIRFSALVEDGALVSPKQELARIEGPAAGILTGERTALNFLGHLSGIATATRQLVEAVAGTRAQILDTRKTTPGLRLLEKYAVLCGGGRNHRIGLFDAVLIKDNHLMAVGSISEAVARAREAVGTSVLVEVEVETLDQLREAMAAGADIVMLDNMGPETMREAVRIRNEGRKTRDEGGGSKVEGRRSRGEGETTSDERRNDETKVTSNFQLPTSNCLLEASGGITLASIRAVAETGVDYISAGWITHSAPNLDMALELDSPSTCPGGGGG